MAFWNDQWSAPKQKSRFVVKIGEETLFNVKSVTKPKYSVDVKEYTLLNHKFKYPGIPAWDPITIVFVDPRGQGVHATESKLYEMIMKSGYNIPTAGKDTAIEKASNAELSFENVWSGNSNTGGHGGNILIQQIDADGKATDTWSLFGPVIKSISFGDLAYDSDDLVEYTLEVEYDYATFK